MTDPSNPARKILTLSTVAGSKTVARMGDGSRLERASAPGQAKERPLGLGVIEPISRKN